MALRDVTTALDALTLTEWRDTICSWLGQEYSGLSTTSQAELNRLINEAHDWVSKTYGHQSWAQRVWTIGGSDFSAPSTSTGQFDLPHDIRHVMAIQESEAGTGATGRITSMSNWMSAGADLVSHPWTSQSTPYYFFRAMSDANPPVEIWQRTPIPTSTIAAMTIVGRPYFTLLGSSGDTQYTEIPPQHVPELRHHLRAQFAAFEQDYAKVTIEMQLRDDAVRATQINDAPFGAEGALMPQPPEEFYRELRMP